MLSRNKQNCVVSVQELFCTDHHDDDDGAKQVNTAAFRDYYMLPPADDDGRHALPSCNRSSWGIN